jgi:hypothetical protein
MLFRAIEAHQHTPVLGSCICLRKHADPDGTIAYRRNSPDRKPAGENPTAITITVTTRQNAKNAKRI